MAAAAAHSVRVLRELNRQRAAGQFCDATLGVGGREFRAHWPVLASCSRFFRARGPGGPVALPEGLADTFQLLLDFFYTGRLALTAHNRARLLAAAEQLGVPDAVALCRAFRPAAPRQRPRRAAAPSRPGGADIAAAAPPQPGVQAVREGDERGGGSEERGGGVSVARWGRRGDGRLFPRRPPPRPRRRRQRATAGGGTAMASPFPRKRPCGAKSTPLRGRRPAAQGQQGRRGAEKVQRCRLSAPHVIKPSSANITLKCTTGKRSDFSFPLRSRVGTCAIRSHDALPLPTCSSTGGGLTAGLNTTVSPGMEREVPSAPPEWDSFELGGFIHLQNP